MTDIDLIEYIVENDIPQHVYQHPERGEACNYCLAKEDIHPLHLDFAHPRGRECSMCGFEDPVVDKHPSPSD